MMEAVMGKMPDRFMRAGARAQKEYFKDGRLDWPKPKASRQSKKDVKATRRLEVCSPILFDDLGTHVQAGHHTTNGCGEQELPGSRQTTSGFRSSITDIS